MVVRPAGDPKGRLGLWVENGMLCMEMEVGSDLLIVRVAWQRCDGAAQPTSGSVPN